MAIYTVHAPPVHTGDEQPDPLRFAFVKEGWCWPALFFALPWLLFRRMWLVAVAYVVIFGALAAVDTRLGGGPVTGFAIAAAILYLVMEGNQLRRWTLNRRGYALVGVVEGRNMEEAEIRYFAGQTAPTGALVAAESETLAAMTVTEAGMKPAAPRPQATTLAPMAPPPPRGEKNEIVGLFPARQGS